MTSALVVPVVCQPVLPKTVAMKERPEWALDRSYPGRVLVRHQCEETKARLFPSKQAKCPGCGKQVPSFWRLTAFAARLGPLRQR